MRLPSGPMKSCVDRDLAITAKHLNQLFRTKELVVFIADCLKKIKSCGLKVTLSLTNNHFPKTIF